MTDDMKFIVYCKPQPQGSSKAFAFKTKTGGTRAVVTSDNKKLKPYRQEVTNTILAEMQLRGVLHPVAAKHEPVWLVIDFYFEKPPSVPKKRAFMTVKPDLDKLVRATKDALTGLLYVDDGQVVGMLPQKHYGSPERVCIRAFYSELAMTAYLTSGVLNQ